MLIDGRSLGDGSVVETDVCVVGAGPAGLSLASALEAHGVRVAVVESGGEEPGPAQELSRAVFAPDSFQGLEGLPRRQLGGNANVWIIQLGPRTYGVRLLPLDPVDFEPRAWLPLSGWPLDYDELEPYYARAAALCGVAGASFDGAAWEGQLPLDAAVVRTAVFHVADQRAFTDTVARRLRVSPTASLFLHLTVTELRLSRDGASVDRVTARRLDGGTVAFAARRVVLAAGGVENARLLLAGCPAAPGGLGNASGLVGRCFMEHPFVRGGVLEPADRSLFDQAALYDLRPTGGHAAIGHLALAPDVRRREQLLNVGAVLFPRSRRMSMETLEALRALRAARGLRRPLREPFGHAGRVVRGLPSVARIVWARARRPDLYLTNFLRGGWSRHEDAAERLDHFEVVFLTEQAPDPLNRIVLTSRRDRFGLPLPELRTRWGAHEARSIRRTRELLAAAVSASGIGDFVGDESDGGLHVSGSVAHHHLGTTRAAADPRHGVVDAHLRVHGIANLFVAGSSVFPTGGYANPTLTIVSLSLRLADRLAAGA